MQYLKAAGFLVLLLAVTTGIIWFWWWVAVLAWNNPAPTKGVLLGMVLVGILIWFLNRQENR